MGIQRGGPFRALAAIGLGLVLGPRYGLDLSWWIILPWAAGALALGWWTRGHRPAMVGSLYGFCVVIAFFSIGYSGEMPLAERLPPTVLAAFAGALCGLGLALTGAFLRSRIR